MSEAGIRAHVVVPEDVLREVDALVGPRRRSEFFVAAARERLARERLRREAHRVAGSLSAAEIPGWETRDSTGEWIRALRSESDRRLSGESA